jgi:hypothetical protein
MLSYIITFRNEGPLPYGNIMYDRRIIRGNTYAQHTLPAVSYIAALFNGVSENIYT